jgi:hypothetical protein
LVLLKYKQIDKLLSKLTKRENIQINKKDEKRDITTGNPETRRSIKSWKTFPIQKCRLDKCIEEYNLLKLYQDDIGNLSRYIVSNKIKTIIKTLPTEKSPGMDEFTTEFYHTF